jgi:hypothetical protein
MPSVVCFGYVALILAVLVAIVVGTIIFGSGLVVSRRVLNGNNSHYSLLKVIVFSLPISVITALIVGCVAFWVMGDALMSSFYPPSPRQEPSEKDVVGVWQLTQGSLDSIQEDGYEISTHTIEIRADGTFTMINLPDSVWNFGKVGGKFESGSGKWSIKMDQNRYWTIALHFTELNGFTDDLYAYFYLSGEKPPYRIYDYIGDADSGRIISFEKRP